MIFGNVRDQETYRFLKEEIQTCFSFLKENDMACMETGSYPIDEEKNFVNIVEYETKEKELCKWEAHKKYLDLHVMLRGQEGISLNFIDNLEQGSFVEAEDFLPLEGEENCFVQLHAMDFLLCFPEDGHMPGIELGESGRIKKAIFKVQI